MLNASMTVYKRQSDTEIEQLKKQVEILTKRLETVPTIKTIKISLKNLGIPITSSGCTNCGSINCNGHFQLLIGDSSSPQGFTFGIRCYDKDDPSDILISPGFQTNGPNYRKHSGELHLYPNERVIVTFGSFCCNKSFGNNIVSQPPDSSAYNNDIKSHLQKAFDRLCA